MKKLLYFPNYEFNYNNILSHSLRLQLIILKSKTNQLFKAKDTIKVKLSNNLYSKYISGYCAKYMRVTFYIRKVDDET